MKKYKVGFTDGVYDMFHVGHLNMIRAAKSYCDYLIVGVHSDEIVESYKHRKTIINERDRREIVGAIKEVDKAVINETRDKMKLWELYHFDVIFIGDDWKGTERWNNFEKVLAKVGVAVEYIPYTQGISTTKIREELGEKNNAQTDKS
ncbi:MAG: adenylyltransferase/cytidyltransferase family protein [Clostridia bacterium]|nr:adenylyltransferase/cytidyltransferase family protein [Clostridia bacterium]